MFPKEPPAPETIRRPADSAPASFGAERKGRREHVPPQNPACRSAIPAKRSRPVMCFCPAVQKAPVPAPVQSGSLRFDCLCIEIESGSGVPFPECRDRGNRSESIVSELRQEPVSPPLSEPVLPPGSSRRRVHASTPPRLRHKKSCGPPAGRVCFRRSMFSVRPLRRKAQKAPRTTTENVSFHHLSAIRIPLKLFPESQRINRSNMPVEKEHIGPQGVRICHPACGKSGIRLVAQKIPLPFGTG